MMEHRILIQIIKSLKVSFLISLTENCQIYIHLCYYYNMSQFALHVQSQENLFY
jgi:hypothetical protein